MKSRLTDRLRQRIFRLHVEDYAAACTKLGFYAGEGHARIRLERVLRTVLEGYNTALQKPAPAPLEAALRAHGEPELKGFLYEGAAMGLAVLDFCDLRRRDRFGAFARRQAPAMLHMLYLGYGLASARIPWARGQVLRRMQRLAPGSRWFVLDGFGFHDGMFRAERAVRRCERPARLAGYALRAYDQGLGRSLWWVEGADVDRVAAAAFRFPQNRRDDIWSGVGFAASFAGGADAEALARLHSAASENAVDLALGAVLAANTRQRSSIPADHTNLACRILCGMDARSAARFVAAQQTDGAHRQRVRTALVDGFHALLESATPRPQPAV